MSQPTLEDALRDSGLRATAPRLKILEILYHSRLKHVSAEDVYRLLQDEGFDVGLATVYRVLLQFTDAGILIRRHFESGHALFEINEGGHHDHLVCISCGRVEEFLDLEIERHQQQIARKRGFLLRDHSLSLYGICTDCAKRQGITA